MPELKQLDHLLAILGRARWSDTGQKVPLRWIEAAPEARARGCWPGRMTIGPR